MGRLFKVLLLAICLGLAVMSLASAVLADKGMVPIGDVSVYGPGQKAIIAWNGEEEILILSTDVRASGDSQVLELLPLPSKPQIEKGDFASFEQVDNLIKKHFPARGWDRFTKGVFAPGEGVEIVFHEKIGAHDITVVKAGDSAELVHWAEKFLKDAGIEHEISSPKLESLVNSYITRGINFFVFDLVEVTSEPKSIEPIMYRFDTGFLYYPLKISTLASGWTDISLFLLTPQLVNLYWLPIGSEVPRGLEIGRFYGNRGAQPIQFKVAQKELVSIDRSIAGLLGGDAWLIAMGYHGDLAGLTQDLKLGWISPNPKLVFDCYQSRCASEQKSQAIIGTLGDTIVAHGLVITPTPCYGLKAKLEIPPTFAYPPTIIVDITAQGKPGVCIECLGEIPFRVEIGNLAPRTYDVIIQYQNKILDQERVVLPPLATFFELLPQATLKTIHTSPRGFVFNIDGEVLNSGTVVKAKVRGSDMRLHLAYLELDESTGKAIIEVNGMPAMIQLSSDCQLRVEDSQLFLDTNYWLLPVRLMPDRAVADLELELHYVGLKTIDGKAIYEIQGMSHKKLLGLVSKEIKVKAQVDAATREIIKEEKPWWAKICW